MIETWIDSGEENRKGNVPQSKMRFTSIRNFVASIFYVIGGLLLLVLLVERLPQGENDDIVREEPKKVQQPDATMTIRTPHNYPKRKNMEACEHPYGRVKIFIAYQNGSFHHRYRVAQQTLKCYLQTTNYELLLVDLYNEPKVKNNCDRHKDIMFRRHCALLQYLNDTDWMLVMDADTAVVNPEHCIEEWIDDRVNLIFYERFFNWEITAGIFLVKNSEFAYDFIKRWSMWEFDHPRIPFGTSDNCVLHMHTLQTIFNKTAPAAVNVCNKIWHNTTGYESYLAFVFCTKIMFGANRFWPGKLKILPRAQGFARDSFISNDKFHTSDFMFHGWKLNEIGQSGWRSPFEKMPDLSQCAVGTLNGWFYHNNSRLSTKEIYEMLLNLDRKFGSEIKNVSRVIPWSFASEMEDCFPNCFLA
ncbi:unnamed protein product, partial [Mesorhabditis belari]|uniref:Nucleotide-diphospho-sugar transferase domain-containing protein n=1 Tax=Mesorhabditis belari TaxID=2138241 RepID=A0AAF3F7H4_9BILA